MSEAADLGLADLTGLKYVGTRPVRPDGVDKVTGRAAYGADHVAPGAVVGKVLRSPHAHARILSIDTSAAEALPGVVAVITAADFPDRSGFSVRRKALLDNVIASDKVLYHGQPVAAVAATSRSAARAALAAIDVRYEVLPAVTDLRDAMRPDAPLLHEHMFTEGLAEPPEAPSNISRRTSLSRGDVEAGFGLADQVIRRSYSTSMVHQGYIEPHACVGDFNEGGQATLWVSSQGHFDIRNITALALGMREADIRTVAAEIGGGFGGKTTIYLEPLALALSRKARRPVRMTMTREEVFRATGPAPGTLSELEVGFKRDGTLTAVRGRFIYETGAYPGSPVDAGLMCAFAPYRIDAIDLEGFEVVANRPRVAAYRAPGAPQASFAAESILDEIAQILDMDPIDLRLANAVRSGDRAVFGPVFPKIGLIECLEAARRHPHYRADLPAGTGRGIAVGFWRNAGNQSSASVHLLDSGLVQVVEGNPDIGGSRASMALMAAERLGVPYDQIRVRVADTDSTGYCFTTGGSRTTFATGMAVIGACDQLIEQCKARAAMVWETSPEQVEWRDGSVRPRPGANVDVPPMGLRDLARLASRTGGPLAGRMSLSATEPGPSFAVNIADVHVDPETGRCTVQRFTAIQDVGKAIHPDYVEGQMQGGAAQGIGWALNEAYVYDAEGVMENAGFLDYRVPVASDLPMIDTVLIEVPNPSHPYGVRGVGETPIVPPLAAVGNAVSRAIGKRASDLPLSPPRLLELIEDT